MQWQLVTVTLRLCQTRAGEKAPRGKREGGWGKVRVNPSKPGKPLTAFAYRAAAAVAELC